MQKIKRAGSNGRIAWVDALKGIGIFFVVSGHFYTSESSALVVLYSFHMPLFFFLSGYLYSNGRYAGYGDFLKKKWSTRLVPYLFFFTVSYLALVIRESVATGMKMSAVISADGFKLMFFEKMAAFFRANGESLAEVNNIALWFIPCLFITELYFFFLNKLAGDDRAKTAFALAGSSVAGYCEGRFLNQALPWGIDTALTGVVFYGAGYLLKSFSKQAAFRVFEDRLRTPVLFPVLTVFCIALSQLNGRVDMNTNIFGNYLYFYAAAFAGIGACFAAAPLLSNAPFLAYLGRNSLTLLGIHILLYPLAVSALNAVSDLLAGNRTIVIQDDVYVFIVSVLVLAFAVPAIFCINAFLPFIAGKRKTFKPAGPPAAHLLI
jgi:fucose 4-O-acetylase-like acetyltransferase